MGLKCQVCWSPFRDALETLWDTGTVAQAKLATDFSLDKQAVSRHLRMHRNRTRP